jgi:hypothetical protein
VQYGSYGPVQARSGSVRPRHHSRLKLGEEQWADCSDHNQGNEDADSRENHDARVLILAHELWVAVRVEGTLPHRVTFPVGRGVRPIARVLAHT